ncbi:MAG: SpoIIE family protein phosphatase [Cryomorphaceae bacterium]|nr:SpoIIE family protein phosphatase [Cryomorphaceae bacterium]
MTTSLLTEQEVDIRILLLEDYQLDAELITIQIKRIHPRWEIRHVKSKTDFKRELVSWNADIVVSDYSLHNFTGIEALHLMKEMDSHVPFILITGDISEEKILEYTNEGVDDYIMKSSLLRLESAIKNAVTRKNAEIEKKTAVERLNETSKRYKTIFDRAAIALIEFQLVVDFEIKDAQYNSYVKDNAFVSHMLSILHISAANEEAINLFDVSGISQLEEHFKHVFRSEGACVINAVIGSYLKNKAVAEVEFQTENLGGTKLFLKVRTTINKGRHPSFTASFIDLTAIKKSEREVREMMEKLEITVGERTSELSNVNNLLKSEAEAKERINNALRENYIQMTESIIAAKRIQQLLLPPPSSVVQRFKDAFIYMRPKDIVSGDFYWFHQQDNECWIACVDCTGHGVPGAFMSMISAKLLTQAIVENKETDPGMVLEAIDAYVVSELKQHDTNTQVSTGMDISLCHFNFDTNELKFSGAFHQLYHIHNQHLAVHRGDRYSLGGTFVMAKKSFKTHHITFKDGDSFYMSTDGYVDQFGGEKSKKFTKRRFQELLVQMHGLTMYEQELRIKSELQDWKGANAQIDDILVIGLQC